VAEIFQDATRSSAYAALDVEQPFLETAITHKRLDHTFVADSFEKRDDFWIARKFFD
jgi:hypothetical protein